MIKKWFEILSDHRVSMRERMFRIVTVVCMIALVFTLPMGRRFLNIVILVISLAAMAMIAKVSIRKERVEAGATAIVVLLLVLFPFTFFPQAGSIAACPSGLFFALSMCALRSKGSVWPYFSGCVWRRRCFATALPFISRKSPP